jgi:hypothetical protein
MIWAGLAAFCATECATARILCNRISAEFSPKNRDGFQDGWLRSGSCRWRITEITQLSAFGISLDNASAIDNN